MLTKHLLLPLFKSDYAGAWKKVWRGTLRNDGNTLLFSIALFFHLLGSLVNKWQTHTQTAHFEYWVPSSLMHVHRFFFFSAERMLMCWQPLSLAIKRRRLELTAILFQLDSFARTHTHTTITTASHPILIFPSFFFWRICFIFRSLFCLSVTLWLVFATQVV